MEPLTSITRPQLVEALELAGITCYDSGGELSPEAASDYIFAAAAEQAAAEQRRKQRAAEREQAKHRAAQEERERTADW